MTILVPIALFGWIGISVIAFLVTSPQRAVVFTVIAGVLVLPMASYDWPGIPVYDKTTAIALGLLLARPFSAAASAHRLRLGWYDLPVILWCSIVPFASALANNLGFYDGISSMVTNYLSIGVFFWAGRRYFGEARSLRTLTRGIILGGAFYIPLVLFEVRMSPQLSNMIYGFFAHSWIQHLRFGGFRPIVFMQHGLMVAFWMAVATTVTYWMWRTGQIREVFGVPAGLLFLALVIATLLSRSVGGWIFLAAGILSYSWYMRTRSTRFLRFVLLCVPFYIWFRLAGIVSIEQIRPIFAAVLDEQRVASLVVRLRQEELFGLHALRRPLLGWGGYGRGWPRDPATGRLVIAFVDARWVILLSNRGLLGLVTVFFTLMAGPWLVLRDYARAGWGRIAAAHTYRVDAVVLSLILVLYTVDSLMNAMQGQIYFLIAGALVSHHLHNRRHGVEAAFDNGGDDSDSSNSGASPWSA